MIDRIIRKLIRIKLRRCTPIGISSRGRIIFNTSINRLLIKLKLKKYGSAASYGPLKNIKLEFSNTKTVLEDKKIDYKIFHNESLGIKWEPENKKT